MYPQSLGLEAHVEIVAHIPLVTQMESLSFEQCLPNAAVMNFVEAGSVSILTVVHIDGILVLGHIRMCDQFSEYLSRLAPINNLGILR